MRTFHISTVRNRWVCECTCMGGHPPRKPKDPNHGMFQNEQRMRAARLDALRALAEQQRPLEL